MSKPKAPTCLGPSGRAVWRKILAQLEDPDDGQLLILQGICESRDRVAQAQKEIKANGGITVLDRFGQPKAHPACAVEYQARAQILTGYRVLGLDLEHGDD
jgi:P27 family predicted phage terminase small subunit